MKIIESMNYREWQQRNREKFNSLPKPQKQNQQYGNSLAKYSSF